MQEQMYHYFHNVEDAHWWFQGRREIVTALIERYYPKKGEKSCKVLDLGCSTGMMLSALQKYGSVWGMDKSKQAIEYASKKVPEANLILGSFPEQMPKGQFDLITALDVIEHLDDDRQALSKLADALKPNGILVVTAPAFPFLWTSHDDVNWHKRRYSLPELKQKILDANLEIKKISYYNTFLFFPIAVAKLFSRSLLRSREAHVSNTPPPAIFNLPLRILFSLEKYFLPFVNFPFGISLIAAASKK